MDFIQSEAIDESQQTPDFSDDEMINDEDENVIYDSQQPMQDVSFHRQLDPEIINHYKFPSQTRDPRVTLYEDDEMFFGNEDTQPEFYDPENRGNVEFDTFKGFGKSVKKFKDTLQNFKDSDNLFFDSKVYGVMFKLTGKTLE